MGVSRSLVDTRRGVGGCWGGFDAVAGAAGWCGIAMTPAGHPRESWRQLGWHIRLGRPEDFEELQVLTGFTAYLGEVEQVVSFNKPLPAERGRGAGRGLRNEQDLGQRGYRSSERCVDCWSAAVEVRVEGIGSQLFRAALGGPQARRRGDGDTDRRGGWRGTWQPSPGWVCGRHRGRPR